MQRLLEESLGRGFWRRNRGEKTLERLGESFLYNFSFRVNTTSVMNALNPIEELYDLYSDKEEMPRIVEVVVGELDFNSDIEDRLADPYLKL